MTSVRARKFILGDLPQPVAPAGIGFVPPEPGFAQPYTLLR